MSVTVSAKCKGLDALNPKTKVKIEKLFNICEERDIPLLVTQAVRSVSDQDELFAQGRTKPGNIVTQARGSDFASMHQWYLAVDFAKNSKTDAYSDDAFFRTVGKIAVEECELDWGGAWPRFPDRPHLQDSQFGSVSELKKKYSTPDKFKESWEA